MAYVVDNFTGKLMRVDLDSAAITTIATGLVAPADVAISNDGKTAYITEYGGQALSSVDIATGSISPLTTDLTQPLDVDVASNGTLYVLDMWGSAVAGSPTKLLSVDPETGKLTLITGELWAATDMVLEPDGKSLLIVASGGGDHPPESLTSFVQDLYRVELATGEVHLVSNNIVNLGGLGIVALVATNDSEVDIVLDPIERAIVDNGIEVNLETGVATLLNYDTDISTPIDFVVLPDGQNVVALFPDGISKGNIVTGATSVLIGRDQRSGFKELSGIALAP